MRNKSKVGKFLVGFVLVVLVVANLYDFLPLVKADSIENIVNGDFETGDFTGWYFGGSQSEEKDSVTAEASHNGTYCLKIAGGGNNDLYQNLTNPLSVSGITEIGFWVRNAQMGSPLMISIRVQYTDETFYNDDFSLNWDDVNWYWKSLYLPDLDPNKSVDIISISCTGLEANFAYIDDISLSAANIPICLDIGHDTVNNGYDVNVYSSWLGNLDGYILEHNATGTPTNSSWAAFSDEWANGSINLVGSVPSDNVTFTIYANSTTNDWASASDSFTVPLPHVHPRHVGETETSNEGVLNQIVTWLVDPRNWWLIFMLFALGVGAAIVAYRKKS